MEYSLRLQVEQEKIQLLPSELKVKGVRAINQGIDTVKSTPYYLAERINRVHALDNVNVPALNKVSNPALNIPFTFNTSLKVGIKLGLKQLLRFSLYAVAFIVWFLCTYYN